VDEAYFEDSEGKDRFRSTWTYARMAGPGYFFRAVRFEDVIAQSSGGGDVADFSGSRFDDMLDGTPDETSMMLRYDAVAETGTYKHTVRNFRYVRATGENTGQNDALLHSYNPETDVLEETPEETKLYNHRFSIALTAFDEVLADPGGSAILAAGEPALGAMAAQQVEDRNPDDSTDDQRTDAVDAVLEQLWSEDS
jgi:hypothetical protein